MLYRGDRSWNLCLEQCRSGMIDEVLYIRVEGGMSQSVHCRVIDDLYRSRYSPGHEQWQDVVLHGTVVDHVESILETGLICGDASREDNDKRA